MVLWKNKGLIHRTIINVDIFFSEICEKICNLLVADNWTKIYKQNLVIGHLTFTSKCTLRLLFLINNYIILMVLTMKRGLINKSLGILTITVIKCVKNCCGHYLNSNTKNYGRLLKNRIYFTKTFNFKLFLIDNAHFDFFCSFYCIKQTIIEKKITHVSPFGPKVNKFNLFPVLNYDCHQRNLKFMFIEHTMWSSYESYIMSFFAQFILISMSWIKIIAYLLGETLSDLIILECKIE